MNVSTGPAALEWRDVVKDYAAGLRGLKLRAVDHLSLRVEFGQVFGLLGPNGSGKTTALKLLLGLVPPTAGECSLLGLPSTCSQARRSVGYLPESPVFPPHLTGRELVVFHARLAGLGGPGLAARVADMLELVGMNPSADRRVRTYSKGMLQRIGLAQALVHDPALLILDEPTAGVDPAGALKIRELIVRLKARGKTIVVTSHLPAELEVCCDAFAIMDRGRLLFTGAVADLDCAGEAPVWGVGRLTRDECEELVAWLAERGRALQPVDRPRLRLERVYPPMPGRLGQPVNTGNFSWSHTLLIAHGTVREALRQRLVGCFLALALALVFGARWLRDFNFGAPELKFIADCGFGAMYFFGAALAVAGTAQLFLGEVESRAIVAVLAKPIRRDEYLVGKFLGVLAVVAAFCAFLTGLLMAVLWWREGELWRAFPEAFPRGRSLDYANLVLAGFLQWLKLAILAAFALLIASFAQSQLFTIVVASVVLVFCHLHVVAQAAYARSGSVAGRILGTGLRFAFPDFHVFSLVDPVTMASGAPAMHVVRVALYGFAYVTIICALAAFSFRRREI